MEGLVGSRRWNPYPPSPLRLESWSSVVDHAKRLGPDCFVATVRPDGDPHLAVVSPGFVDDLIVVAISRKSVKGRNLRAGSGVMLHWIVSEETGNDMLLVRGEPSLVDDERRCRQLWEADCLPFELTDFYRGPDDPVLLWVEIAPTYASLHRNFGADGSEVWRRRREPDGSP